MSGRVVGEVVRTKIEIEWRIPDFFSLPQKVGEYINSHSFFFRGKKWWIFLYPSGWTKNHSMGYIGIYLGREDEKGSPRKETCTFFLKSADGKLKEPKGCTDEKQFGFACYKFFQISELILKKEELAPSSCVTIVCVLRTLPESVKASETSVDVATQTQLEHLLSEPAASEKTHTPSECSIEKLSRDLDQLLSSGENSDMTIHVKEKEFRLHRGIVGARVPVFSTMFQHEMREKATGSVSIDDCDVDVFQDFVYYVYSGRVDKLRTETVFGLFVLADKYQVDELKSACFEFIKHTLSVSTFCDVVNLALTYGERELLQQATDFLAENMAEIMETVKWMNFMTESPIQANEILLKAIRKK